MSCTCVLPYPYPVTWALLKCCSLYAMRCSRNFSLKSQWGTAVVGPSRCSAAAELEADPGIGDESFERSPGVHGPDSVRRAYGPKKRIVTRLAHEPQDIKDGEESIECETDLNRKTE